MSSPSIGTIIYRNSTEIHSNTMRTKLKIQFISLIISISFIHPINTRCQSEPQSLEDITIDLTDLSLEELAGVTYDDFLDMVISGLSKTPKSLSDSSAAYFVIDQEDIRRSGAHSIPELLRMVPGLNVARIDANKWAVSSRGFNDRFANNLLVMVDGRNVYSSFFNGVHWDVQDYVLADIERIEVIRGPGASLWGANATNGVINIVTKKAEDTQGGLVTGTISSGREKMGSVRYGDKIGDNTYFRIYGKYKQHPDFDGQFSSQFSPNTKINDEWNIQRSGFRLDSYISESDEFTVQGDIYKGNIGTTYNLSQFTPPYIFDLDRDDDIFGGNFLTRYKHTFDDDSEFTGQIFYDRSERAYYNFLERTDVFDIDLQYYFSPWENHKMIVGGGYRFLYDDYSNSQLIQFSPESRDYGIVNFFIQDDIYFFDDDVILTLGSKFEYNDFTGSEIQPSARILWKPYENHILWAAVTRAVRTPSRLEDGVFIEGIFVLEPQLDNDPPIPFPIRIDAFGTPNFKAEDLIAYEIGYRFVPLENLFIDTTAFYNVYDNLQSVGFSDDLADLQILFTHVPPIATFPIVIGNERTGETYGFESSIDYNITDWWDIDLSYTFLEMQLRPDDTTDEDESESPQNQISLRTGFDLPKDVELDFWFRYTDRLPGFNIDDIYSLDIRLGWKPREDMEFVIGAHSLLDSSTAEFGFPEFVPTKQAESERSVYTTFTWTF